MELGRITATSAVLLLSAACSGYIGDRGASPTGEKPSIDKPEEVTPPGPPDRSFDCDPNVAISATPLRRLSAVEYQNTLRDLFAVDTTFDVEAEAASALGQQPVDDAGTSFRRFDVRLSENHVEAFFDVADALATAASSDTAHLAALAGDCARATPTTACVDAFLDRFAMRAFRRPLTEAEKDRYRALNDGVRTTEELYFALFFSVLMAPQFLYRVEVDGAGDALTPYELASRLSYHFWQSMPDDALLAAAADGSILTDEVYRTEAERVFDDPRTKETIRGFYSEWFRLRKYASLPDTPVFDAFTAGTGIGEPGDDFLEASAEEIEAMTAYYTWEVEGSFRDLLVSDLSFTRSPSFARIYGVEPWDGQSAPPRFPSGERSGLLTRAAFLISGTHTTHPIHRGATVRQNLLCDTLAQPDPNALPPGSLTPPPVTPDQTTRERYENKVANQPCAGCHVQMNPIGYVLERYDAIGRFRNEEHVLDGATGAELSVLPIDSTSTPRISPEDDAMIDSGIQLGERVAASGKVEACFARNYFRYAFGRNETTSDACTLEPIRSALADDASLEKALFSITTAPSFRMRRVE